MTGSTQNRLLMIHIYQDELDKTDIKLTSEFVKVNESRISTFGLHQF